MNVKKKQRRINAMVRTVNEELEKMYGSRFEVYQKFRDYVIDAGNRKYHIGFEVMDYEKDSWLWIEFDTMELDMEILDNAVLEVVQELIDESIEEEDEAFFFDDWE